MNKLKFIQTTFIRIINNLAYSSEYRIRFISSQFIDNFLIKINNLSIYLPLVKLNFYHEFHQKNVSKFFCSSLKQKQCTQIIKIPNIGYFVEMIFLLINLIPLFFIF